LRVLKARAENDAVNPRRQILMLAFAALFVPLAGLPQSMPKPHASAPPHARVDINYATVDQLMRVPGMTRTWAGRIVRFRPYRSKNDLLDRGVVTTPVYDRIRDYVIAHRDAQ
jgi:DNA uptake protein ComE-like DNA-binding protein